MPTEKKRKLYKLLRHIWTCRRFLKLSFSVGSGAVNTWPAFRLLIQPLQVVHADREPWSFILQSTISQCNHSFLGWSALFQLQSRSCRTGLQLGLIPCWYHSTPLLVGLLPLVSIFQGIHSVGILYATRYRVYQFLWLEYFSTPYIFDCSLSCSRLNILIGEIPWNRLACYRLFPSQPHTNIKNGGGNLIKKMR